MSKMQFSMYHTVLRTVWFETIGKKQYIENQVKMYEMSFSIKGNIKLNNLLNKKLKEIY